jgi:hypothetical protein
MQRNQYLLTKAFFSLCGTLVLALLLVACGGDNTAAPSAQQLLQDAQAAIQKVSSYHFTLQATNIGTSSTLPIQSADGDVVVPDKLQANATVLFNGGTVTTKIISIGNDQYIYLVASWQKKDGLFDPRALTNSQTGLAAFLGAIQNPSPPSDSSSGGQPCWSTSGKIDASLLAGLTGGGVPPGTLDDVTTCIGKSDHLPYLIIVKGMAAQGDSSDTTRTIMLSKFNEQITITAPPGV